VGLLVDAAHGVPVTFHRAFDFARDFEASLEALVDAGVQRVLSSGGAPTAVEGVTALADLVRQAGSRLTVIAGGGVREENVRNVVSLSGVKEVHVRLTRLADPGKAMAGRSLSIRKPLPADDATWEETDEKRVRSFVKAAGDIH